MDEERLRSLTIPTDPSRFPVLTGRKIPGRDPELAERLRALIDELEEIVDELDDRYELPISYGHKAVFHGDVMTWGSKYAPEDD